MNRLTVIITILVLTVVAAVSAVPAAAAVPAPAGLAPAPEATTQAATYYTVRQGDTLARIAARYGTTVAALMRANPSIRSANHIWVGQRLLIPSGTAPYFSNVKIALISLENGTIGCGDGYVLVSRQIEATQAPLTAALRQLLGIKDAYYGQSGLYNALHRSNLAIQSVAVLDGVAQIRLTGQIALGGTCDAPRVQAQLEQTARQFSTVKSVNITVNGKPLSQALSGQ